MQTIAEIYRQKQALTNNSYVPMFPHISLGGNYNFMDEYEANAQLIDKTIVNRFCDFFVFNAIMDNDVDFFDDSFKAFLLMNKDNFQKIFDGLLLEYSPIENVDEHNITTLTYKGKETNTLSKDGSEKQKTTYTGSEKDEVEYTGKESATFSTPTGGYTDTVETLTSPEDAGAYVPLNKQETKTAHREDKSETEYTNRKDTNTKTYNSRADETETTYTNREDVNKREFENRQDETVIHRHGNVGLTTNTQLLTAEVDFRLANSFYPLIFTKFIKEITIV